MQTDLPAVDDHDDGGADPTRPLLKTEKSVQQSYTEPPVILEATGNAAAAAGDANDRHRMIGFKASRNDDDEKKKQGQPIGSEIDGFQAWLTLACVFMINANTLGSLKVYGLIFEEIVSQKFYNREEASWPISTASTIQNLAGLLTPLLALKISWRSIEILQTMLFVGANVGAYFSSNLTLDIVCLGLIQGVALSLRYNMNIVINNEYFVNYRATAMGISLAGSTFGAFALKPVIAHVLDTSQHQFRNAYLALAVIVSFNIILNLLIRKPRRPIRPGSPDSQRTEDSFEMDSAPDAGPASGERATSLCNSLLVLIRNPNIHCIWIMQTVYFYISRTYTIFVVDYGVDQGLTRSDSRSLLDFWVYGEISGRLLLGSFVDSGLLSLKWNMVLVNLLLSACGFLSIGLRPSLFADPAAAASGDDGGGGGGGGGAKLPEGSPYLWLLGLSIFGSAALSSLVNMLIVPFGQEYLGKRNVPWAFAIGSIITSVFLLFRPSLVGLSRDHYKTYDLLILVMSSGPLVFAVLFCCLEPLLRRYRFRNNSVLD